MPEDIVATTAPAAPAADDFVGDSGAASGDARIDTNAEDIRPEVTGGATTEQHDTSGKTPMANQ